MRGAKWGGMRAGNRAGCQYISSLNTRTLRYLQECYMSATRVLQYNGVTRALKECLRIGRYVRLSLVNKYILCDHLS
jgi:hypothetical protein